MTTDNNNMEIIPAGGNFGLLERAAMTDALTVIDENLSASDFSILSLPRIRVAGGGAVNFRYETTTGEETAKKLTGIITAARRARLYWKSRTGGKKPPDCTSIDGFVGVGDPGGSCRDCPYARFGSAPPGPDGRPGAGQACKDVRQVLFLLGNELLPHLLSIPPTSTKAFSQFMLGLASKGIPYWSAITELSLEKASNEASIDYAKILFRLEMRLKPAEQAVLKPYHQRMKALLVPAVVDASAYELDEEERPPARRTIDLPRAEVTPQDIAPPKDSDIPF